MMLFSSLKYRFRNSLAFFSFGSEGDERLVTRNGMSGRWIISRMNGATCGIQMRKEMCYAFFGNCGPLCAEKAETSMMYHFMYT